MGHRIEANSLRKEATRSRRSEIEKIISLEVRKAKR